MSARPTRRVRWAWNSAFGGIVEPPSGDAAAGWQTEQRPPAQYLNFLQNQTGVWVDFLSGPDLSSWTQRDLNGSPPTLDGHTVRTIIATDRVTADGPDVVHWAMVGYVSSDTLPTILISQRGNVWVPRSNAPAASGTPLDFKQLGAFWWLITSGGGHLYRTALAGGAIADDMASWSAQTLGAGPSAPKTIAYDGVSHFAVIAQNVGWYSLDGSTWLAWNDDPARTGFGIDIVYDGVGWMATTDDAEVLTATSVTDLWTVAASLDSGTSADWRLTVGPDVVIAWKRNASTATAPWQSTDHGATWAGVPDGAVPAHTHRLAYEDGVWMAAGEGYPYLSQSNDLVGWYTLPLGIDLTSDPELYEVATDGATWIAVGDDYTWRSGTARDVAGGSMVPGSTPPVLSDAGYLRGHIVASDAPSAGNVLVWSAITGWTPQAQPGGLPTASGASEFAVSTGAGTTYTARTVAQTRTVLGLGGAALLAVGTASGTVAAGDDSRITGAVASSTLTTRGDIFTRGASAIGRLALGAAKRILSSDGTDALYQTIASLMEDLGSTRGSFLRRGASAWEAVTGAGAADTFLGGDGSDLAVRTASQVRASLMTAVGDALATATDAAAGRAAIGAAAGSLTINTFAASTGATLQANSGSVSIGSGVLTLGSPSTGGGYNGRVAIDNYNGPACVFPLNCAGDFDVVVRIVSIAAVATSEVFFEVSSALAGGTGGEFRVSCVAKQNGDVLVVNNSGSAVIATASSAFASYTGAQYLRVSQRGATVFMWYGENSSSVRPTTWTLVGSVALGKTIAYVTVALGAYFTGSTTSAVCDDLTVIDHGGGL